MSNLNLVLLANDPESLKAIIKEAVVEVLAQHKPVEFRPPVTLLNQQEVAEKLGVSQSTIIQWKKKGIIPYIMLGNRCYYELSAILAAGREHEKYTRWR